MMDTKEALKELEDLTVDYGDRNEEQIARLDEAIDMAMGALKAQADGDTISRKAAIHAMEGVDWYHINKDGQLTHGANSKEDEPLYKAKDVYVVLNKMPSAETHDKRTETHSCDLISRQAAIDAVYKCSDIFVGDMPVMVVKADAYEALAQLPSAQPTLYGYPVEHLALIARVLQKENFPPERIAEKLSDVGRIVEMVRDEFEETLRKAVEQCTMT